MSQEEEPKEPILDRVRKLLAKAENPGCTPDEAAAFFGKAAELIAKYGIDQALLANAGKTRDEVGDRVMVMPDPYARQKAQLLVNIAMPLRVRTVFHPTVSRRIKGFQVHMFGFESDIQRVEILLTSLLVQAAFGMAKVRPEGDFWREPTPSQIAAFRRDWMEGFGAKVYARLMEAEERAVKTATQEGSTGTDLVLVDRNAAVNKAVELRYPKLKSPGRPRTVRNADAYHSGVRAGAAADLGGTRVGQVSRQRIGS